MKLIPLTKGLFAQVDDEDYDMLMRHKWQAHKSRNTYYANSAIYENGKQIYLTMHRVIMKAEKGVLIDHKDRNGLNCQKSNLRKCNHSENNANRKSSGYSRYLGVSFFRGKWVAQITINKKTLLIGSFDSEKEAAIAYDKRALEVRGEFANPNFKQI